MSNSHKLKSSAISKVVTNIIHFGKVGKKNQMNKKMSSDMMEEYVLVTTKCTIFLKKDHLKEL